MAPEQDPEDIFSDVDPAAAARSTPRPLSDYIASKRLAPPPQLEGVVAPSGVSAVRPPAAVPNRLAPSPIGLTPTAAMPQRSVAQPIPVPQPLAAPTGEARGGGRKRLLILVLFLVMLGGVAGLGWYFYAQWRVSVSQPLPEVTNDLNTNVVQPTPQDPLPAEETEVPVVPAEALDSDADGLTDADEQGRGTNPQSPDSDNDGLADREEVVVYKTNPLVRDTDGDGYEDGTEVQGGYNPNGPGTQLQLPQ